MNHSDVARSSRCRSRDVHGVPSGSSVANVIGSIFAPGTGRHVERPRIFAYAGPQHDARPPGSSAIRSAGAQAAFSNG